MRSRASIASQLSNGTVRHSRKRSQTIQWPLQDETTRLDASRLASRTVLNYIRDFDLTRETPPPPPSRDSSVYELAKEELDPLEEASTQELPVDDVLESEGSVVPFPPREPASELATSERDDHIHLNVPDRLNEHNFANSSPFKRWLSTLRKRHDDIGPRHNTQRQDPAQSPRSGHLKSLSISSSMGILTGVKSAALTLAGTSIAPTSRYGRQGHFHSDTTSHHGPRLSIDSMSPSVEVTIDRKAWYRSVQRRNIVEEIVQSEASYISDMKAMVHVRSVKHILIGHIIDFVAGVLHPPRVNAFDFAPQKGVYSEVSQPDHPITRGSVGGVAESCP